MSTEMNTEMNAAAMAALGPAAISADELDAMVGRALGRPVTVTEWQATPIEVNAITTEAVLHLHGVARAGGEELTWNVLVKVFRSPRDWPMMHLVPEAHRQTFIDGYPWRGEHELRMNGVAELMPDGLRLPGLYGSADLGDDRIVLWTEWIDAAPGGWNPTRYCRAAELLGRMTARWRVLPGRPVSRRSQLRQIVDGPILQFVVPRIADPGLARHPLFAGSNAGTLFVDLAELADRLPALMDRFETLERSVGHGDACPQNLLVSRTDPDTLVAIDLSWPHPEAIGYDLAQLLIGHAHSGDLPVRSLPELHDAILDAFVVGLRQESCEVPVEDVRFAFETTLVIRCAFQSLPLEHLDEPVTPELADLAARRVELTRYLVDVGLAIRV